jgi:hypothetical protein
MMVNIPFCETGYFHGSEDPHYDLTVTVSEQLGSRSSDFYLAGDEFKSSWDKGNVTEPMLWFFSSSIEK